MYEAPPPYPGIDPNLAPYPGPAAGAYGQPQPPHSGQAPPFTNGHPQYTAAGRFCWRA